MLKTQELYDLVSISFPVLAPETPSVSRIEMNEDTSEEVIYRPRTSIRNSTPNATAMYYARSRAVQWSSDSDFIEDMFKSTASKKILRPRTTKKTLKKANRILYAISESSSDE